MGPGSDCGPASGRGDEFPERSGWTRGRFGSRRSGPGSGSAWSRLRWSLRGGLGLAFRGRRRRIPLGVRLSLTLQHLLELGELLGRQFGGRVLAGRVVGGFGGAGVLGAGGVGGAGLVSGRRGRGRRRAVALSGGAGGGSGVSSEGSGGSCFSASSVLLGAGVERLPLGLLDGRGDLDHLTGRLGAVGDRLLGVADGQDVFELRPRLDLLLGQVDRERPPEPPGRLLLFQQVDRVQRLVPLRGRSAAPP